MCQSWSMMRRSWSYTRKTWILTRMSTKRSSISSANLQYYPDEYSPGHVILRQRKMISYSGLSMFVVCILSESEQCVWPHKATRDAPNYRIYGRCQNDDSNAAQQSERAWQCNRRHREQHLLVCRWLSQVQHQDRNKYISFWVQTRSEMHSHAYACKESSREVKEADEQQAVEVQDAEGHLHQQWLVVELVLLIFVFEV